MKIFNIKTLLEGRVEESILVHSFVEYKSKGGEKDAFDIYSGFKEKAKEFESQYISLCDQKFSGIPVEDKYLIKYRLYSQVFWTLLHKWFNKPLRKVSYASFDLKEFNEL